MSFPSLHEAVLSKRPERLRDELSRADDVDVRDQDGRTALMEAVISGNEEMARMLLEAGADVDAVDRAGWTALHFAAQEYLPSLARMLLDHGAFVDAKDTHGNTPLARAVFASRNRGDVIWLLLAASADPDLENYHGVSPRKLAHTIANYDARQFLEEGPTNTIARSGAVTPPETRPLGRDEPFMEHPTGEFSSAVEAMAAAIERLRALERWERWMCFDGQGQGSNEDAIRSVEVRLQGEEIEVGPGDIDLAEVFRVGGLKPNEVEVQTVDSTRGLLRVRGATPVQVARLLDGLFRGLLGVQPFDDDEGDYAVGAEWCDDGG